MKTIELIKGQTYQIDTTTTGMYVGYRKRGNTSIFTDVSSPVYAPDEDGFVRFINITPTLSNFPKI